MSELLVEANAPQQTVALR